MSADVIIRIQTQSDTFVGQLMKLTCNKYQWLKPLSLSLIIVQILDPLRFCAAFGA